MRTRYTRFLLIVGALAAVWPAGPARAQSPADALKTFAASADIGALMAKARAERKPDQPNYVQPVLRVPPYMLNLEYRMPGLKAPASLHETEAELFLVVEGSGTAVTGGRLENEKRSNAENLSGTAILDGQVRTIAKGDVLFVPERTPHWFDPAGGPLVLLSLHVPRR